MNAPNRVVLILEALDSCRDQTNAASGSRRSLNSIRSSSRDSPITHPRKFRAVDPGDWCFRSLGDPSVAIPVAILVNEMSLRCRSLENHCCPNVFFKGTCPYSSARFVSDLSLIEAQLPEERKHDVPNSRCSI